MTTTTTTMEISAKEHERRDLEDFLRLPTGRAGSCQDDAYRAHNLGEEYDQEMLGEVRRVQKRDLQGLYQDSRYKAELYVASIRKGNVSAALELPQNSSAASSSSSSSS